MRTETAELMDSVVDICSTASLKMVDAIKNGPVSLGSVHSKSSYADLVTDLDVQIQDEISAELRRLTPRLGIVGEEGHGHEVTGMFWTVDPIDGTTNVVHGVPRAATSVALWEDAVPILGVVSDPFSKHVYLAIRGGGAFKRPFFEGNGSNVSIRSSETADLASALIGFGLPYNRTNAAVMFDTAQAIFSRCQDMRRLGSSSLDFISVATGEYDAYVELDLRAWDIGAGALIVEESGGKITSWDGKTAYQADPSRKSSVVASNGVIHDEILALIKTVTRKVA
jgi:myo-inositol-1(or 4)-monophosphatase